MFQCRLPHIFLHFYILAPFSGFIAFPEIFPVFCVKHNAVITKIFDQFHRLIHKIRIVISRTVKISKYYIHIWFSRIFLYHSFLPLLFPEIFCKNRAVTNNIIIIL